MPILAGDIKFLASKVMDDVPEGGGGPIGTIIPDGASNAIFQDVTEFDRAGGAVSIRQMFLAVQTPTVQPFMDANIIVSAMPNDANVSVTLAKCGMFHRRTEIANAIENYLIQGPEWGGFLLENHVIGQRSIQIFQRPGTPTPPIGRTLVLIYDENLPTERRQFVRVTKVEVAQRMFTTVQGGGFLDYPADVVTCDLSDALRQNFPGSVPDRLYGRDPVKTVIRDTTVADAATYYGAVPLTIAAALGDSQVRTASIYSQLVPSARTETVALDQRPAALRQLTLATSPRQITIGAAPHTRRTKVGQENRGFSWVQILKPFPAPNSVVVSFMALGVWYTLTDDGLGNLTGSGVGTVNYANGSISLTLPSLPDVGSSIIYAWGEKSAFTDRSGQAGFRAPEYALKLDHAGIKPGTLVATWMSGGVLRTSPASAAGVLSGDATGELNAASGTLFIRPKYMPDAGAQFVFAYEWAAVVTKSATVTPDAGGYAALTTDTVPAPGSVTVRWITVANVTASGGATAGGSASSKKAGGTSTTVYEPNPDYTAPEQPTAPTAPTGPPVEPGRKNPAEVGPTSSVDAMQPKMVFGGTRVGTGSTVFIRVMPVEKPGGGGFEYPTVNTAGVVWSDQEFTVDKRKVIDGVSRLAWQIYMSGIV